MIPLSDEAQARRDEFIARLIETEVVFALELEESIASVESGEFDGEVVLLFWSDRADAKRARKTAFKEYEVIEISLFEFIFKWLSGMDEDEVLVGVNRVGALTGAECDPEQLQEDLLQAMDVEKRTGYYDALQLEL